MAGERLNPGTQTLASPHLAGGVTNSGITTATARPYSLATMDVDTGLTLELINKKLQLETVLDSVFEDLGADVVFNGKKIAIPDACVIKLSGGGGARTQVMPLLNPFVGPARYGTDQGLSGYERQPTLQYMKVYYNEYCYGAIGEKFGMNFNDLEVFNYYSEMQPGISRWYKEDLDRQYHEALLETYGYILEGTGTALTQNYNNNWFIANTEFASQPAFSTTPATFAGNINTAFAAADTGTNGVNANIDLDYLLNLEDYAQNTKRINPVTIGGKKSYVVLLPSSQYNKLRQITNGQLGQVWENVSALSQEEQNFPGIVGRVSSLVIVEDQRYPTLKCTNSYGDATHTVEYVNPGNQDSRNKAVYVDSSNAAWDIGFLLGAGALIDWTVTPQHFEMDEGAYGKVYGKGVFCERGIQLGRYDLDTAGNGLKNFGSIVLAFTSCSRVTTA